MRAERGGRGEQREQGIESGTRDVRDDGRRAVVVEREVEQLAGVRGRGDAGGGEIDGRAIGQGADVGEDGRAREGDGRADVCGGGGARTRLETDLVDWEGGSVGRGSRIGRTWAQEEEEEEGQQEQKKAIARGCGAGTMLWAMHLGRGWEIVRVGAVI